MLVKLTKLGLAVCAIVVFLVCLCIDIVLLPVNLLLSIIEVIYLWVDRTGPMYELIESELYSFRKAISAVAIKWKDVFESIMHLEESIKDDEAK